MILKYIDVKISHFNTSRITKMIDTRGVPSDWHEWCKSWIVAFLGAHGHYIVQGCMLSPPYIASKMLATLSSSEITHLFAPSQCRCLATVMTYPSWRAHVRHTVPVVGNGGLSHQVACTSTTSECSTLLAGYVSGLPLVANFTSLGWCIS